MNDDEWNKYIAQLLSKAGTNTDKLLAGFRKTLIENYKKALDEIRLQIAKMYEKYGTDIKFPDMVAYNRLTNLEYQIAQILKKLNVQGIKTIKEAIKEIYSENYYYTGFVLETSIGAKLGFGLLNEKTIEASVLNSLDRITWPERFSGHIQQLNQQIRTEITQGLIQGKGYVKIAKAITDKTNIAASKASLIVQTEAHRVQNAGALSSFSRVENAAANLGIEVQLLWIHSNRAKVPRPGHIRMDMKAAVNNVFTLPSGVKTPGPGLSGIAEEDIHCHCTMIQQFKGLEYRYRRNQIDRTIVSMDTYEKWKTARLN